MQVNNGDNIHVRSEMVRGIVDRLRTNAVAQNGDASDYLLISDAAPLAGGQVVKRYEYLQWRGRAADPRATVEWQFALLVDDAEAFEADLSPDMLREAFAQTLSPLVMVEDGLEIKPSEQLTVIDAAKYVTPRMTEAAPLDEARRPAYHARRNEVYQARKRDLARRVGQPIWTGQYILALDTPETTG